MEKRFPWAILLLAVLAPAIGAQDTPTWTKVEREIIRGLWIGSLEKLPPDPSNGVSEDPRAVRLGHRLFFDTRFSRNGTVACATCHKPELGFQDNLPRGVGIGTMNRRTMPIAGTAYSPWLFWDGRKDSQWAQALGPMESAIEHGGNRTMYAHLVSRFYTADYQAIFGPLPDLDDTRRFPASAGPVEDPLALAAWNGMAKDDRESVTRIYVNIGKSIAAYERMIVPGASRFDSFAESLTAGDGNTAVSLLTPDEQEGLKLFLGKAECIKCHNGPLFTNNDFHNTGVPAVPGLPQDLGRAQGARQVRTDEFNCQSPYSDAAPADCAELRFMKSEGEELTRAYKPPSLRNVADRTPYMHAGQFKTLSEVLRHYNSAPPAPSGHSELNPLGLSGRELSQLESFLRSLSGPLATPVELLRNPLPRPTVSLTEGPFYTPGSPERTDLAPAGATGRHITITGVVSDLKGAPIAGAWLDFWQADADGRYDNAGFRFRGHQRTGADGRYRLSTVVPGEYPGRTPHIHLKLRAPGGPTVTTQIFFPGTGNLSDPIFDPSLLIDVSLDGKSGRIDFAIPRS